MSRVYREVGLFDKNACYSTQTLPNATGLIEMEPKKGDKILPGDIIVKVDGSNHAMIFVSGNPLGSFTVIQSGGNGPNRDKVNETSRNYYQGDRYFRSSKCTL